MTNNQEVIQREIERVLRLMASAPEANHRIFYGSDPCHFGDLFLPVGPGPHPLVIFFHGGWWRSLVGLEYTNHLCKQLAKDGIAVWNVEFRRIGETGGGFPNTFFDLAAGTDFVHSLAQDYPIDLNRIVAMGHSAGGHISLWLSGRHRISPDSPIYSKSAVNLRGAISLSGVVDLRVASQLEILDVIENKIVVHELLNGTPVEVPDNYAAANPGELLPIGIPQILIHGMEDEQVPYKLSTMYSEAAKEIGDDVELILLQDANHFDLIDPTAKAYEVVKSKVIQLLR
ncbi:alpha/beta hydrolase family protein [Paenibacillus tyrfis]|uniref:alpha/beta hydrolase family protein n=1 Tax=Paenibacillus tyrfis TaxID=1501230 RepID=UPI00209DC6C8|nr:alpha/beta hydrolase [Paenibacillus tyrfis]MCP1311607.1 alpha/beta hydrolase [Paenibacillus tyrfis]